MSKNSQGNWTKVGPANTKRTSVKTSIPGYLVAKYMISVGDTLEWDDDGEFMKIRKIATPDNGTKSEEKRRRSK